MQRIANTIGVRLAFGGAIALLCACPVKAQIPSSTQSQQPTGPTRVDSITGFPRDSLFDDPSMRVKREIARREEQKRRMEVNAARLLQLTSELRADLEAHPPTEADSKRLDEIAKLAHAVREQMKQ